MNARPMRKSVPRVSSSCRLNAIAVSVAAKTSIAANSSWPLCAIALAEATKQRAEAVLRAPGAEVMRASPDRADMETASRAKTGRRY